MPRFFISSQPIIPKMTLALSGGERKHLNVLRLKKGEKVIVANGRGDEFLAEIIKISTKEALLYIDRKREAPVSVKPRLILGQSIPRFSKMELILQKGTELGIDTIYPVKTKRSYLSKGHLNVNRWDRWDRILQEAGKQSGRSTIPELKKPLTLSEFLIRDKENTIKGSFHLKLLLWEAEQSQSIGKVLRSFHKEPDVISFLVGPEGGFSNDEAQEAQSADYHSVSLGRSVLRVETASIALLSILQYEWGEFNFLQV